jgi:hypothetical protein
MDTCPKCHGEVELRPFQWKAPPPVPQVLYICVNCEAFWFQFETADYAELVVDIRDIPPNTLIEDWISQLLSIQ